MNPKPPTEDARINQKGYKEAISSPNFDSQNKKFLQKKWFMIIVSGNLNIPSSYTRLLI
jgi:hypothetical protein